jgi:hypothetical protein
VEEEEIFSLRLMTIENKKCFSYLRLKQLLCAAPSRKKWSMIYKLLTQTKATKQPLKGINSLLCYSPDELGKEVIQVRKECIYLVAFTLACYNLSFEEAVGKHSLENWSKKVEDSVRFKSAR